jgi:hypothetical protein
MSGIRAFASALAAIVLTTQSNGGLALAQQDSAERVITVTWKAVATNDGTRQSTPVFLPAAGPDLAVAQQIVAVEEAYRIAKLTNDVRALDRILSADFFGTNQNGNSRNKREALELFASFPIASLVVERAAVRVSGDAVLVTGEQTEVNGTGTDRMLFTRVYMRSETGWQLLSNTQFRNPRTSN